jgi:hypothetical protein
VGRSVFTRLSLQKKANDIREPDTRIRPERPEQEKTRLSRSCPLFFGSGGGGGLHKKYGLRRKGTDITLYVLDYVSFIQSKNQKSKATNEQL